MWADGCCPCFSNAVGMCARPDAPTELRMTPSFEPRGVWGRIYWWIIAPSHSLMFKPMLRQMVKAAGVRVLSGPSCVAEG